MADEKLTFYPSETYATPLALVSRERVLPVAGEVLVREGQRVEPADVIARAEHTRDIRILDLARGLRVSPKAAERSMRKKIGDSVVAGEPVAIGRGVLPWSRKMVRAPVDGTIAAVGGGRLLLEVAPEIIEVKAYLSGTVALVLSKFGAVVETAGALVQASWGCGGEAYGVLKIVGRKPDSPLRAKSIDVACHGAIVISGGWIDPGAFEQAQQLQVRGIIAASMDGDLRAEAEKCGFPVILIEGWGRVPMSAPAHQLLQNQDGREACISASTRTRFGKQRPEIVIPLPTESQPSPPPPPGAPLEVGMRVRVLRTPYMGAVGTVAALPAMAQRLDNGIQVHGAEVNLGSAGTIFVPYVNLELLR
ncbi:MAG: hypothetical protein JW850_02765 [Thermoflexales bacterium]|nr:hypothetical protein [Thermoflexales bacterium]